MIKIILILLLTLIVVPLICFHFDEPLTAHQSSILKTCINICLSISAACFLLSEVTRNYSQVDKLWSIIPTAYGWYIAYAGGMQKRLVLMAILETIWMVRLTYNFSRRGGYCIKFWSAEEDYRWAEMRKKPELSGKMRWFFFNVVFISIYQNVLLMLIVLPSLVAVEGKKQMNWLDLVATVLFLFFVVLETVADQQQWNFQVEKSRRKKTGEPLNGEYSDGFIHTGLWRFMRHPNYMSEQAIWIVMYLFSVSATGRWINWSISGCLLLVILFQASANLTEEISSRKYPGYKEYQDNVGRFIPKIGKILYSR